MISPLYIKNKVKVVCIWRAVFCPVLPHPSWDRNRSEDMGWWWWDAGKLS